ncbi:MAG: DUF2335 domain-containing protein [Nitrospirae bacterium]|nr:DUF2335 domain-containing protein [Nitrospirota bacterium]MBF0593059.1 DUF2335 domain-containing protein [Nitrospirota bacterium]
MTQKNKQDDSLQPVPSNPSEKVKGKVIAASAITFSGPIPPPDILKRYGELSSDFPERIIKMAEEEAIHAHDMERERLRLDEKSLDSDVAERKRGQHYGLIIGLSGLASAIACIILGSAAVGGIIGGTTVGGLVTVFVIGRYKKEKA